MIKCIAVDDEPLALNIVDIFCNKTESLNLLKTFTNGLDALAYIDENEVDLIFLDINMPHISGVEFAKRVNNKCMIVFTTAYQNYAVEGFELDALDYLLKPFSYARFMTAVTRAESRMVLLNKSEEEKVSPFIMIRSDYSNIKLNIDSIISVEGLKDYVKIYTEDKNHITKITMKSIEQNLADFGFMRVHKSYIVNLKKVVSYEYNKVLLSKNLTVSIGNIYRNEFVEYIDKNKLK